jgi:hypothetical protein
MDTRASVIRRPAPSAFAALGSALPFLPPLTVRRHLWYAPPCVLRRNAAQRCAATLRSGLQRLGHSAGYARPPFWLALTLTRLIGVFRTLSRSLASLAALRRRQVDAGAPRFGQPNRDRLFSRARAMLAVANFVDLIADKFARLGRGGFAFMLIPARLFNGSLQRHCLLPILPAATSTLSPADGSEFGSDVGHPQRVDAEQSVGPCHNRRPAAAVRQRLK